MGFKNILIIDNHKIVIEGYKRLLGAIVKLSNLHFYECIDCLTAYQFMNLSEFSKIDLILMDSNLPIDKENSIKNGLGLLDLIGARNPRAYIVFLTQNTNGLSLYSLYKNHTIDAIITKSEANRSVFSELITQINKGDRFYSENVLSAKTKIKQYPTMMDSLNRTIIRLIDEGLPNNEMSKKVNLSISGLNKRKARIKEDLGLDTKLSDYYVKNKCKFLDLI